MGADRSGRCWAAAWDHHGRCSAHQGPGARGARAEAGQRDPAQGERVFRPGGARAAGSRPRGIHRGQQGGLGARADLPGPERLGPPGSPRPPGCAARSRPPSARSVRDEALKAEITRVHQANYGVLGARKIHVMLNRPERAAEHGLGHIARCATERVMRILGIQGARRAGKPSTTIWAPRQECPADLVERHFSAEAPNRLWVADIPPLRGRYPLLCAHPGGVGVHGVHHGRLLAADRGLADQ